MLETINAANDFLWTYVMIALLIGAALWFTILTRGVQFRYFGAMWSLLARSGSRHDHSDGSGFQSGNSGMSYAQIYRTASHRIGSSLKAYLFALFPSQSFVGDIFICSILYAIFFSLSR